MRPPPAVVPGAVSPLAEGKTGVTATTVEVASVVVAGPSDGREEEEDRGEEVAGVDTEKVEGGTPAGTSPSGEDSPATRPLLVVDTGGDGGGEVVVEWSQRCARPASGAAAVTPAPHPPQDGPTWPGRQEAPEGGPPRVPQVPQKTDAAGAVAAAAATKARGAPPFAATTARHSGRGGTRWGKSVRAAAEPAAAAAVAVAGMRESMEGWYRGGQLSEGGV